MRKTRTEVALALTATLVGLGACSSTATDLDGDPDGVQRASNVEVRNQAGIHLFVQVRLLDAYPDALYTGTLAVDERGCVRLEGTTGPTSVLWPPGFTARQADGAVQIVDAEGRSVVRAGQPVQLGGGGVPFLHEGLGFTPADQELAVSRCPGDFWIVAPGSISSP